MRSLRLLITLWLCLSMPYAALASALRDPQCVAGQSMAMHHGSAAMPISPAAHAMHAGMTMAMHHSHGHGAAKHTHSHCSCLLSCACSHACATSGCAAADRASGSDLALLLTQESPRLPATAAQRAASPTELLRPPTRRA